MKVELIGINGKMLASKIEELKLNPEIDRNCYNGTREECLMEFAGRVCYNSGHTGKTNRNSKDYFANIKESRHTSIFGHSMIQIRLQLDDARNFAFQLCNEPGWYFSFTSRPSRNSSWVLVTLNLRLLERLSDPVYLKSLHLSEDVGIQINEALVLASKVSPLIFAEVEDDSLLVNLTDDGYKTLTDLYDKPGNHKWYSFYIEGSRSFSHEYIRHSYESSISQRSTRFVDESSHSFEEHPLFHRCLMNSNSNTRNKLANFKAKSLSNIRENYDEIYNILYDFALNEGKLGLDAKKQARGAMARFLMHGLSTSLVYTATKREFDFIFEQRINDHADEEIHEIAKLIKAEIDRTEHDLD